MSPDQMDQYPTLTDDEVCRVCFGVQITGEWFPLSAMCKVKEEELGGVVWPGRIPSNYEAEVQNFGFTESVAKIFVQSVLSISRWVEPFAEIVGKLVNKTVAEYGLRDIKASSKNRRNLFVYQEPATQHIKGMEYIARLQVAEGNSSQHSSTKYLIPQQWPWEIGTQKKLFYIWHSSCAGFQAREQSLPPMERSTLPQNRHSLREPLNVIEQIKTYYCTTLHYHSYRLSDRAFFTTTWCYAE